MMVGRYPFTGHKVAGSRANDNCPYCMLNEPETTDHFILRCELYSDIRENMFKRMNKITNFNALSDEDKVKIIIDPSVLASDEDEAISLESDARQEIFSMHNRRAVHDGRGSMYKWAVARAREGSGVQGKIKSKSK